MRVCANCQVSFPRKNNVRPCIYAKRIFCSAKCRIEKQLPKLIASGPQKGCVSYRIGVKLSDDTKLKISLAKRGVKLTGEHKQNIARGIVLAYDRKGRREYRSYEHVRDKRYKDWRTAVFERDKHTCQGCGASGIYMEAHHIKSWAHYPEERYDLSNGMTLCIKCHKLTDNYKNKKYARN